MTSDLKPYPKMKDPGVEWMGEVPEHWEVKPTLGVFRPSCKRNTGMKENTVLSLSYGRIIVKPPEKLHGLVPESFETYQIVNPGDIILRTTDLQNDHNSLRVGQVITCGIITSAYLCLKTLKGILPDYGYHLLNVWDITKGIYGYGSGLRQNLDFVHFRRMPAPIPPLPEQTAIVRYLDYMDRRIRRLIRAKRKLITLLNEQKQVIIHHAVTRGLDPNVPLKDSGVEWLGMVPEHWEVVRIKQATHILRGKFTHRPRNDPSMYDGPYPFIQTGEVARALKSITKFRQTLNERGLNVSKMFPAGTLVMTIAANIGDVAVLDFEACFPDSIVGFLPKNDVERDYLYFMFRAMRPELLKEAPVNTQGNLNIDRVGSRKIVLPPHIEQNQIIESIESATSTLDTTITRAQREIDLLTEYRTRLIADVVTGKVDVREVAAGLPEVDPLAVVDEVEEALNEVDEELLDDGDAVEAEVEP
ncbi:restriction endonuclease subunit S [Desulfonatronum parangueonense]